MSKEADERWMHCSDGHERERVAYLGLGSNCGDRLAYLRSALDAIAEADGVDLIATSAVYETEPVGEVLIQHDFLNLAARAQVRLGPVELLTLCKRIESDLGRTTTVRHGPRVVDVDILLLGDLVGTFVDRDAQKADQRRITLPHPMILQRRFVLQPLIDLDPEIEHPAGERLRDALEELDNKQRVVKVMESAYTDR